MHRPAVTLTFTLMGEWLVGGNEILWRRKLEETGEAAWSVSPWCLPLSLGASQGLPRPGRPKYLCCLGPHLLAHKSTLSPFSFLCPWPLRVRAVRRGWHLGIR